MVVNCIMASPVRRAESIPCCRVQGPRATCRALPPCPLVPLSPCSRNHEQFSDRTRFLAQAQQTDPFGTRRLVPKKAFGLEEVLQLAPAPAHCRRLDVDLEKDLSGHGNQQHASLLLKSHAAAGFLCKYVCTEGAYQLQQLGCNPSPMAVSVRSTGRSIIGVKTRGCLVALDKVTLNSNL